MTDRPDLASFRASLRQEGPPPDLPRPLLVLWHAARGEWAVAHEIAQAQDDEESAWVHAYLHREEGDVANAGYWYRRARRPVESGPLAREWETIVEALLAE